MSKFAIRGNFLSSNGSVQMGIVQINNRSILACTNKDETTPPDWEMIELPSEWLLSPGLIDIQINGSFGCDFTSHPETIPVVARKLPEFGVTAFLPTIISTSDEKYQNIFSVFPSMTVHHHSAHILGLHMEGPYLNPEKRGAHQVKFLKPTSEQIPGFLTSGFVKMVTLAPELSGGLDLIRDLVSAGIKVGLGHSNASYEQGFSAVETGASFGTHLFNASNMLHHRNPSLPGLLLSDDRLIAGLIADTIHIHPAILKIAYKCKGPYGLALISDATAAAGNSQQLVFSLDDQELVVKKGVCQTADGTLSGTILTLAVAMRNMKEATECTLAEAALMASTTPAKALGLTQKGSIAPGFDADLVILDSDGHVQMTIVAGDIVYKHSHFSFLLPG